jgi:hypothetical protein
VRCSLHPPQALTGRFLEPIGWNLIGDAMYQFSLHPDRLSRHPLMRLEDPEVVAFFGNAYEEYARDGVLSPADEASRKKFRELRSIGRKFDPEKD